MFFLSNTDDRTIMIKDNKARTMMDLYPMKYLVVPWSMAAQYIER